MGECFASHMTDGVENSVILSPTNGLIATFGSNAVWQLLDVVPNEITRIGHVPGEGFRMGGLVFTLPDLRYVRIIDITLRVRLEFQSVLNGTGTLETGAYVFDNVSDAKPLREFSQSGIDLWSQYVTFNVTRDRELFNEYPRNIAFSLWFAPQNVYNGFVRVNSSACELIITYERFSPLPPSTLQPDLINQNPNSVIELSWLFNPNTYATRDEQEQSILHYRVNSGDFVIVNLYNAQNSIKLPPGTFSDGDVVEWKVQTVSNLGVSDYSEIAKFNLARTPPLAPVPVFPVNISVSPVGGVLLSWNYNSPYDNAPSRFDVQFRINNGTWQTRNTDGAVSILLDEGNFPSEQSVVEWRVRGYGEFLDVGPWSSDVLFWVRGIPARPVITSVSNSNRPTVTFSATNAMSYELEILQNGERVYFISCAFGNVFTHQVGLFFPNGMYVVRMRVANEYSLFSNWFEIAVMIDVVPPPAACVDVSSSSEYCITLFIGNTDFEKYKYYIYRSEGEKDAAKSIGLADDNVYKDYKAAPGKTYLYFVRTVSREYIFDDSSTLTVKYERLETLLAPVTRLRDVVVLSAEIGTQPKKVALMSSEREFIKVLGREYPIVEHGTNKNKKVLHSYFVDSNTADRLREWASSSEVFCLRDWRYGTVFGTFDGDISLTPKYDGYRVKFDFIQVDY